MNRFSAMEAFVRVVETGSFSHAAKQLHAGQPAISKLIAQLEDRLGVRLLIRSTHGMTPSEAGQNFYEHAKRALHAAEEADLAARGASAALQGRLKICAAVTFARIHVIPRLPSFLERHPELELELVLDDRNIDLIEAGTDVALRMGDLDDSTLTARKIAQGKRVVVAAPGYLDRAGTPATPHDLPAHQSIVYDQRGGGTVWTFRRGDVEATVSLKGRMRINAAEGVRAAVIAGLGVTVASEWMFAPELAAGSLQVLFKDWELPPIDLWAIFPAGRKASAKARAFADFVDSCLR